MEYANLEPLPYSEVDVLDLAALLVLARGAHVAGVGVGAHVLHGVVAGGVLGEVVEVAVAADEGDGAVAAEVQRRHDGRGGVALVGAAHLRAELAGRAVLEVRLADVRRVRAGGVLDGVLALHRDDVKVWCPAR